MKESYGIYELYLNKAVIMIINYCLPEVEAIKIMHEVKHVFIGILIILIFLFILKNGAVGLLLTES